MSGKPLGSSRTRRTPITYTAGRLLAKRDGASRTLVYSRLAHAAPANRVAAQPAPIAQPYPYRGHGYGMEWDAAIITL